MDHTNTYFYKDKPLFGIDIGFSSIKVMQVHGHGQNYSVSGYGIGGFDSNFMRGGEVIEYEKMAQAINDLFKNNLIGHIDTKRVAMTIPSSRTYTRTIELPLIADNELEEAVRLEANQYIPVPLEELYLDWNVIRRSSKGIDILAVATPQKMIDSYMNLALILDLEPVVFESNNAAVGRIVDMQAKHKEIPAVIIDFGTAAADITVYDGGSVVTGTIPFGGDLFTDLIQRQLNVTKEEAHVIKVKYGVAKSKKQPEILSVLRPEIDQLAKEVRRMIRYYEERSNTNKKIGQIITAGGGCNTPGLNDLLTDILRIPVRSCDPWLNFNLHKMQPPSPSEKAVYATVAGLALIDSKEIFS